MSFHSSALLPQPISYLRDLASFVVGFVGWLVGWFVGWLVGWLLFVVVVVVAVVVVVVGCRDLLIVGVCCHCLLFSVVFRCWSFVRGW